MHERSGKDVFLSKSGRDIVEKRKMREAKAWPAPGTYDPQNGFDIKW